MESRNYEKIKLPSIIYSKVALGLIAILSFFISTLIITFRDCLKNKRNSTEQYIEIPSNNNFLSGVQTEKTLTFSECGRHRKD